MSEQVAPRREQAPEKCRSKGYRSLIVRPSFNEGNHPDFRCAKMSPP